MLALDREEGKLRVTPLGERGEAFTTLRCAGAFSVTFAAQHFFALDVTPAEDGAPLASRPEATEAERAWAGDLAQRLGAPAPSSCSSSPWPRSPHAELLERWLRELRKEQNERFGSAS